MRRKTGEIAINGGFTISLEAYADKKLKDTPLWPVAQVIAEVCDMIARGENIYLSFGTNKLKQAFLINSVWDGAPEREAFLDWETLAEAAVALQSPSEAP